jgi:hypothetical protein
MGCSPGWGTSHTATYSTGMGWCSRTNQTVIRAELFAFVSAVIYCQRHVQVSGATCAIWSDCEFIVRRAQAVQQGLLEVSLALTDHDLWMMVQAHLLRSQRVPCTILSPTKLTKMNQHGFNGLAVPMILCII